MIGGGVSPPQDKKTYINNHVFAVAKDEWDLLGRRETGLSWIGIHTDGYEVSAWEWTTHFDTEHGSSHELLETNWDTTSSARKSIQAISNRESIGDPWIPSNPSRLFRPHLQELSKLYFDIPRTTERDTQITLWEDLLKGSGITIPPNEKHLLYQQHILLTAVSRTVVDVLQNNQLDALPLSNSFAAWMSKHKGGRLWQESVFDTVNSYDWRLRDTDVLREDLYGDYF